MMDLIILQAQTAVGAAIQIILMLLGAGLIAVLTTYFYLKSKYGKEILSLQEKLDTSKREEARLRQELSEAEKALAEKTEQMETKLKETEEELKKQKKS